MENLREYSITCPWCWEVFSTVLEPDSDRFETIEDCQVCCHPIHFYLETAPDGTGSLRIDRAQ